MHTINTISAYHAEAFDGRYLLSNIQRCLSLLPAQLSPAQKLKELVRLKLASLPYPGGGQTLLRWQILSTIAAHDLSLAKLYEAHTDAHAILNEISAPTPPAHSIWGVWCSEGPDSHLEISMPESTTIQSMSGTKTKSIAFISGTKSWCSGAKFLTHALVSTYSNANRYLVAVDLLQPEVKVTNKGWDAIGMAETESVQVQFDSALGQVVGKENAYLDRPGFWHGGAGIAACWHGGAQALAGITKNSLLRQGAIDDPYKLAHLGHIDMALSVSSAILRDTAAHIDQHPHENNQHICQKARLIVEQSAERVLHHAGAALGAAAFCRNKPFTKLHTDLTVFLHQSHGEADIGALGRSISREESWAL